MKFWLSIILLLVFHICNAQDIDRPVLGESFGLTFYGAYDHEKFEYSLPDPIAFVSFNIKGEVYKSSMMTKVDGDSLFRIKDLIGLHLREQTNRNTWMTVLNFRNLSEDTIQLSNVVPFEKSPDLVYITGKGDERLSKTKLFLPGKAPVSVIVPDNAWELGFATISIQEGMNVVALTRRKDIKGGQSHRFETTLFPGGEVQYQLYLELVSGGWRDALRRIFRERYLYDIEQFDGSLFTRPDQQWIKRSYIIHLMMAWDHHFYNSESGEYVLGDFIKRGKKLYGGDDVIGIWPTWPTLGLDQRNQWDLYRDLPGGLPALKKLSDDLHGQNVKLFIAYNPWDESTRKEAHLEGMKDLLSRIGADGVVLDTRGSSSPEFQAVADQVREGIVMYSEGMAVPKDLTGIIAGRVHNALYYPPILNLNKYIRPDAAIFRVAELTHERIQREYALAFFNGYGTEINMFRPGQPYWIREDYHFLGKTTRILRENHRNFISEDWDPLMDTVVDSIYVNVWPGDSKIIYTIFSLKSEGYNDVLFIVPPAAETHLVDIWNHQPLADSISGKIQFVPVELAPFNSEFLGTNREGVVGCIASFPRLIDAVLIGNKLLIHPQPGLSHKVWLGEPSYTFDPIFMNDDDSLVDVTTYEGKIVIQLFNKNDIKDEVVLFAKPGIPKLISTTTSPKSYKKAPRGMVKIPSGDFRPLFQDGDTFIYYPVHTGSKIVEMEAFFMDIFPVTNGEYKLFIEKSGYNPPDENNYLKHWINGQIVDGEENHPVVYVSLEDAREYAKWAGKRLPAEIEWQYAAQTTAHFNWPWGMDFDPIMCNPGNGVMDPVGKYPQAANPFQLQDLVGNVWQLTNDTYTSGSYTFTILKGGSYFKPESSWWYVKGGPQPLQHRQILLHVSPGFDRNATVGFRCIADYKSK